MTNEERADLVYKLLKNRVLPTQVAAALDMDHDTVMGVQAMIRIEQHGTDEISEAMTNLIWTAVEVVENELRIGTPASKQRFIQLVLARSIGLAGKSTPEASERVRAALEQFAADAKPPIQLTESIYTPTE